MKHLKSAIRLSLAIVYAASLFFVASAQAASTDYTISDSSFRDVSRDRTVPYKLYMPTRITSPAPVVIFSHGLGGSTEAAPYLGKALAQNGYVAFFIQHPGTDKSLWAGMNGSRAEVKKTLSKSTKDFRAARDRYKDLPFVIDMITKLKSEDGELKGKLDLYKIGMAGHSYGARSVMTAAGESGRLGTPFKDTRIKAGVVLSPNLPQRMVKRGPSGDLSKLYSQIDIPLFHITGTKDGFPFSQNFDPATRTLPYQNIQTSDQYLMVLDGAEHSAFGGRKNKPETRYQTATAEGAVLFFDAYLKGDQTALQKLRNGFESTLNSGDVFEYK